MKQFEGHTPDEVIKKIPVGTLIQGLNEILEDDETGLIRENGIVRNLAKKMAEITESNTSTLLFLAGISIPKQAAIILLRQRNELLEALEECKDALTHLYNFGQPAIIGKTGWEDFTNTFSNAAEHAQIAINNCKKDDQ